MRMIILILFYIFILIESLLSQKLNDKYQENGFVNTSDFERYDIQKNEKYTDYIAQYDTLEWIQNSISLPFAHRGYASVTNGSYIYILGGDSTYSGSMDYVAFAEILPDGSLGNWTQTTSLPEPVWETEAVIYQNNIYVISGYTTSSVYRNQINPDGSLGSWIAQNSLPLSYVYGHTAVLNGNILYVLGDWSNTTIYSNEIDASGNLGTWNTIGTLPKRLYASDAIFYDNKIFLFGGKEIVGSVQAIVDTVRYAEILVGGQLGDWYPTNSLNNSRWFHQSVNIGNTIFVMGGGSTYYNLGVELGIIDQYGNINWTIISENPDPSSGVGLVYCTNFLYYLSGSSRNSIYYSNIDNILHIEGENLEFPHKLILNQNYPNPFNPVTHIRYGLPKASLVKIDVYNMLGQGVAELLNENKQAGYHTIEFDGSKFSSGVYFYKIQAGEFQQVRKMLLVK